MFGNPKDELSAKNFLCVMLIFHTQDLNTQAKSLKSLEDGLTFFMNFNNFASVSRTVLGFVSFPQKSFFRTISYNYTHRKYSRNGVQTFSKITPAGSSSLSVRIAETYCVKISSVFTAGCNSRFSKL